MTPSGSVRGVLLDLSGVLFVQSVALPGAVVAVRRLRAAQLPVRFVTNVTRENARTLRARLAGFGIEMEDEELFTAPVAARRYLEARGLRPLLLVHPSVASEFAALVGGEPDAVLLGDAGAGFDYASLNRAFRLLMRGAPLLAMGNNRYFREADGLSLDLGPFVAALEYASGCQAVILGKPAPAFFAEAVRSIGCEPGDAVMVGDDVLADVRGALDAGLGGILVKTGKYRPGDEDALGGTTGRVVADIAEAVERILDGGH